MCGSQPVGVPFYVYGDNFLEPGTNIYLASADSDVTSSGYSFFQPVMESEQAVSYVFNDQCNLARTGIDSSIFVK